MKWAAVLAGGLALASAPLAWAQRAPEQSAKESDARVEAERLRAELRRLQQELAALRQELERGRVMAPAPASQPEIDARLQHLEQELARVADELKHVSDQLDAISEAERRRPTVTVYGTVQGYKYDRKNSVLDAEAFELVLSGKPHKRLGFFAEIEFERAAAVGGERGGEIVMEQAYASYSFAPQLALRAGVLLVPFGNVNVDHYSPMRDVISKPLVSYAVAPSDWTDNGLQIYGRQLLGTSWRLEYQASLIAGLDDHIDALGMRAARQPFGVDNNNDKALVARLAGVRGEHVELGVSGYTGKYDDANRQRLNGWAIDNRTELGPLRLTGEYNSFVAEDALLGATRLRGYYLRASWDLHGGVLRTLARDFDDPRLTLVAQYDDVRIESPAPGGTETNRESRWTLGTAYRPSRQWVLKLNYEWNDLRAGSPLLNGDADAWLASIGFVF